MQKKRVRKAIRRAAGRKQTAGRAKKAPVSRSHEEALLKTLVLKPRRTLERHLQLQDILYNFAPEFRALAYKAGFNLGAGAYSHSDRSMGSLEHILEHAGLGKVLYHPFELRSTFTSYKIRSKEVDLRTNVHVFEAGVISGYLSAHAGHQVATKELSCVFNGARACTFASSTAAGAAEESQGLLSFPRVASALEAGLMNASEKPGAKAYYMLAIRPLLSEPILGEANKFLYLLGKMVSRSKNFRNLDDAVRKAANFLGVEKVRVASKKDTLTINLTYDHATSTAPFIELSTALISGIVKGMQGRNITISRETSSRGIYSVRMQTVGGIAQAAKARA